MANPSSTLHLNCLKRCETILEELGGWDILVLMAGARDLYSLNENYVGFFTDSHRVEIVRIRDLLRGERVYNLRIWKIPEYNNLCSICSIRSGSGLLARNFEFYTGYSLTF